MSTIEISPNAALRMDRIKKVSGIFKAVFFVLTLACAFVAVLSMVGFCWELLEFFRRVGQPPYFANELVTSLAAVTDLICAAFTWFCYKLFDLYTHGELFTAEVVHSIRRIGVLFFFATLARVFSSRLLHHGQPTSSMEFVSSIADVLGGLFSGFLILFIAWVMDEGRKIREEQELTV
jgi:hypothetical protein